jgi:hypothetical protein
LPKILQDLETALLNDIAIEVGSHDPAYVSGILTGTIANEFGSKSPEVARSLPYTTGAMLGAARLADVHVDDPLGGVLSTEEMIERDRLVFGAARSTGTPIAWNLAGGYQEPLERVIALHVNTMRECVKVFTANEGPVGGGGDP